MASRQTIGFIGLGAMGLGMASRAVRAGFKVIGFDINEEARKRFEQEEEGISVQSPRLAAEDADVLVIVVATSEQAISVLFDETNGALANLRQEAVIILCITASPEFVVDLELQLERRGRTDIKLIDCPISGGEVRARQGTLSLICAGKEASLESSQDLLQCFSSKLHTISDRVGPASSAKLVHQILVGVHILASVEVIGLAFVAGLDVQSTYDTVMKGDSASWLFGQRAAHILDEKQIPASSLSIIAKDLVGDFFSPTLLLQC